MKDLIFALILLLDPAKSADHTAVAKSIESAIEKEGPIEGFDERETASILATMAWRESNFQNRARGDGGKAVCMMQIHTQGRDALTLMANPAECMRRGLVLLKLSAHVCPDAPIAPYASGTCTNKGGRKVSVQRTHEAASILQEVEDLAD